MLKKIFAVLMLVTFLPALSAFALTSDVSVLPKEEIIKLSDEKLTDTYMDAAVEIDASRSFHATSGFTPKQYTEYKELLKYKMLLLMEMHSRNLDIPQLER